MARAIQRQRFAETPSQINSDMGPGEIQKYCPVSQTGLGLLKTAMTQLHLSPRAYHRILKLARTIADLAGLPALPRCRVWLLFEFRGEYCVETWCNRLE